MMVQWLRLHAPNAEGLGSIPGQETSSHMLYLRFHKWSEVKVTQSCPTLCNPMDCTVHGILQARISSGLPCPSPGDLRNLGIEPRSPALQVDSFIWTTKDPLFYLTLLCWSFQLTSPVLAHLNSLLWQPGIFQCHSLDLLLPLLFSTFFFQPWNSLPHTQGPCSDLLAVGLISTLHRRWKGSKWANHTTPSAGTGQPSTV